MDGATIQEFTQLRAEFAKEISALKEKVRAMHVRDFQFRAAVQVELDTLRRDVEWLEDEFPSRKLTKSPEALEAYAEIDRIMGRIGYSGTVNLSSPDSPETRKA